MVCPWCLVAAATCRRQELAQLASELSALSSPHSRAFRIIEISMTAVTTCPFLQTSCLLQNVSWLTTSRLNASRNKFSDFRTREKHQSSQAQCFLEWPRWGFGKHLLGSEYDRYGGVSGAWWRHHLGSKEAKWKTEGNDVFLKSRVNKDGSNH